MVKTIFISGHLDISIKEWEIHYLPKIKEYVEQKCFFVIGDARGCDQMSMNYLWDNKVENVIIYHMFEKPLNNPGYMTIGGFRNHSSKDSRMTLNSDIDLAWVRCENDSKLLYGDKYKPGRISGTQQNLNRRKKKNKY